MSHTMPMSYSRIVVNYCSKCGTKLSASAQYDGHSESTGEELYKVHLECPKIRPWWGGGHSKLYAYNEMGNRRVELRLNLDTALRLCKEIEDD